VIAALGRLDHGGGPVSGEGGKQDGASNSAFADWVYATALPF
jgi:hypothetical protein